MGSKRETLQRTVAVVGNVIGIAVGAHRCDRTVDDQQSRFTLARALAGSALHERIMLAYLIGFLLVVANGTGQGRAKAVGLIAADLALFLVGLVYVRARETHPAVRAVIARLLVLGVLLGSFFELHRILPAARGETTWDARLLSFDLHVFGFEPAVTFDRFVTEARTEWFSFFYFSYFALLAVHVVPIVLFERRRIIVGELALGMVSLYCIGQFVYLLVPGFGPYATLHFAHALEGPTWWRLVQNGALAIEETSRTDIFPSLHTGGPMFLTLFSFRHRRRMPFRLTWPILAFFSSQIMLATMYLRWHYLIDVIVGVLLATLAVKIASRFSSEEDKRKERSLSPIWTTLTGRTPR